MKITIVHYRAFDMPHAQVFYNKDFSEIHETLSSICNTYVATQIITGTGDFAPLNSLTDSTT